MFSGFSRDFSEFFTRDFSGFSNRVPNPRDFGIFRSSPKFKIPIPKPTLIIDIGIGRTHNAINDNSSWGSCGTVAFLAPEQFTCYRQSDKVDVWALGKIIVLIIFEWSFGWQLIWSPKFLKPDEIQALGPLVELIDLLKDMIQVSYCTLYYISDIFNMRFDY